MLKNILNLDQVKKLSKQELSQTFAGDSFPCTGFEQCIIACGGTGGHCGPVYSRNGCTYQCIIDPGQDL